LTISLYDLEISSAAQDIALPKAGTKSEKYFTPGITPKVFNANLGISE